MPGGPEWILIFLVVLLLFGAKRLPDLARGLARSVTEFRKAKEEFDSELASAKSEVALEASKKQAAPISGDPRTQPEVSPVAHHPKEDPHAHS